MALILKKIYSFIKDLFVIIDNPKSGLFMVEYASWFYGLLTSVIIFILGHQLVNPYYMIEVRFMLVGGTALLMWLYWIYPCKLTTFFRVAMQFFMLIFWYSETYEFNRVFPNLDYFFADLEQTLFGCQPAVEFSRLLQGKFWSEIFNLGYWSYFPMIAVLLVYNLFFQPEKKFQYVSFVIITTFFLYYLVFIFLPVAGPQFYYLAIGYPDKDIYEIAQNGFPALGDYFNYNTDLLPAPGDSNGFFFQRVADAQATGERPTAAFPSSHVGCSTVMMILAWKGNKKLFAFLTPFYLLLFCATVYIQAHYLIDAIAGFFTAFLMYYIADMLYYCFTERALPWRRKVSR